MNKTEICIKLTHDEYQRLKDISFDIEPSEYLHKIVTKHLFASPEDYKPSTLKNKLHLQKNVHQEAEDKDEDEDEFTIKKKELNHYGLNQKLVAKYLETSEASVSYMFKRKNKNSYLYPLLFSQGKYKNIIYDMYEYKYEQIFQERFTKDAQTKIKNWLKEQMYQFEFDDNIKFDDVYTIIKILSSISSLKFKGNFSIHYFVEQLDTVLSKIHKIDFQKIRKKDIEYLHDKIEYLAPFLY